MCGVTVLSLKKWFNYVTSQFFNFTEMYIYKYLSSWKSIDFHHIARVSLTYGLPTFTVLLLSKLKQKTKAHLSNAQRITANLPFP